MNARPPARRHRGGRIALLAGVIALGLASRRYAEAIPSVVARYAGDTLWAAAAYVALSIAWPGARVRSVSAGAALIALTVELSQLARPAWLEGVRQWPGARLLLGSGFLASDLVCYGAGIALAAAIDLGIQLSAGASDGVATHGDRRNAGSSTTSR